MSSEIGRFPSLILKRMRDSDKPQIFPVEKDDRYREVTGDSSQPTSENTASCPEIVVEEEEETNKATVSCTLSEKNIPVDDDDGFKTPTSPDHRIPATMQCPPAPRKPRPQQSRLKRKSSPAEAAAGTCGNLQLDASVAEVESIFRQIHNDQDDTQDQKIVKKARTDYKDHQS